MQNENVEFYRSNKSILVEKIMFIFLVMNKGSSRKICGTHSKQLSCEIVIKYDS